MSQKRHSEKTLAAIHSAFPSTIRDEVTAVMKLLPAATNEPHMESAYRVVVGDQSISVPYRVYFPEIWPSDFPTLSQKQLGVLAAIMTRHPSGYQREIWAGMLTKCPTTWTVPFMALLFGDYVNEVIAAVEPHLNSDWVLLVQEFASKNPECSRALNHRILTYWSINYRSTIPRFRNYPGYRVAERLGFWDRKVAPRLTKS